MRIYKKKKSCKHIRHIVHMSWIHCKKETTDCNHWNLLIIYCARILIEKCAWRDPLGSWNISSTLFPPSSFTSNNYKLYHLKRLPLHSYWIQDIKKQDVPWHICPRRRLRQARIPGGRFESSAVSSPRCRPLVPRRGRASTVAPAWCRHSVLRI